METGLFIACAALTAACALIAVYFMKAFREKTYDRAAILKTAAGLCFLMIGVLFAAGMSGDKHFAWLVTAGLAFGVMGVGTSHRVTPALFLPFLDALLSDGGMFIRNGSGALMSAWAAAGRLIGYYEPHMNPWDGLPGLVLMREAGGLSNDYLTNDGIRHGNPLLLASKTLYPQLKNMLCHPLP